jgi:Arc/MetJ-type ribon-helix-helix transcriptional regulator
MTTDVSDRLRDALERLDQAIDRLESAVSARPRPSAAPAPKKDNDAVARQLDLMIERLETALAD